MSQPEQFRPPGRSNRSGRTNADNDVFEGLPVKQWSQSYARVSLQPPVEEAAPVQDDKWNTELPMPRDSHLLQPWTQQLLRLARSGKIYTKRKAESDALDEDKPEDEPAEETKPSTLEDRGYLAKKWKPVPEAQLEPEHKHLNFLAKRRKGLPNYYANDAMAAPVPMRKTRVQKTDANGETVVYEVLVPEGQTIEGEITEPAALAELNIVHAAPGTVIEGVGVANDEGVVIAEHLRPSAPRRNRPPPKKKGGPGRGKKRVTFVNPDGSTYTKIVPNATKIVPEPGQTIMHVAKGEVAMADITPEEAARAAAAAAARGEGGNENDDEDGEEGEDDDDEDGEDDDDREDGELSDDETQPATTATSTSAPTNGHAKTEEEGETKPAEGSGDATATDAASGENEDTTKDSAADEEPVQDVEMSEAPAEPASLPEVPAPTEPASTETDPVLGAEAVVADVVPAAEEPALPEQSVESATPAVAASVVDEISNAPLVAEDEPKPSAEDAAAAAPDPMAIDTAVNAEEPVLSASAEAGAVADAGSAIPEQPEVTEPAAPAELEIAEVKTSIASPDSHPVSVSAVEETTTAEVEPEPAALAEETTVVETTTAPEEVSEPAPEPVPVTEETAPVATSPVTVPAAETEAEAEPVVPSEPAQESASEPAVAEPAIEPGPAAAPQEGEEKDLLGDLEKHIGGRA